MAIYFYSEKLTEGLPALLSSLQATRIRYHDGMNFRIKGKVFEPKEGDTIICWGKQIPAIQGVRVVNASAVEFTDGDHALLSMQRGGNNIPAPQHYVYKSRARWEEELALHQMGKKPDSGLIPHKNIPMLGLYPLEYGAITDVHVFGSEIISATRMVRGIEGYHQHRVPTGKVADKFVNELKALNLDFGVIQVLRTGANNDRLFFNDFTTAPALGDWQIPLYEKAFRRLIETPIRKQPVEIEQPVIEEPVAAAPRGWVEFDPVPIIEEGGPIEAEVEDFEEFDEPEDDDE